MENGKVVAISISERKGEKKRNIDEARLVKGLGIQDDAHAEGGERQVSLLADESITRVKKDGLKVFYGDFAENIVTRGVDHGRIRPGDTILIGEEAVLKVTKIGKECHSPCNIFRQVGYCIMPEEGIFCRVIKGGNVKVGDEIEYLPGTLRFLIITLSDRVSQGKSSDKSGPAIKNILENYFREEPWRTKFNGVVLSDDPQSLKSEIKKACKEGVDFIFTTGGTGIGQRDITPDVVNSLADKIIPGIMEHIRTKYGEKNPKALLSRSIAALIGKTFVYTLPGSVKAVREYMGEILKTLEHCIFMLHNIDVHHEK